MPDSSNLPSMLLSLVRDLSPSYTWMSTPGWLSEYVENTCSFLVGIVVFLLMSVVCKAAEKYQRFQVCVGDSASVICAQLVLSKMSNWRVLRCKIKDNTQPAR